MTRRILLGSYHVPGWAVRAQSYITFFERMQRDCLPVSYVNLLTEQDELFLRPVLADNFGNPHAASRTSTPALSSRPFGGRTPVLHN